MTSTEREGLITAIHLLGWKLYHSPKARSMARYQLVGAHVETVKGSALYQCVAKWSSGEISPSVQRGSWGPNWKPVNWRYVPDEDVVAFYNVITRE